jgi:O-methyltransferase
MNVEFVKRMVVDSTNLAKERNEFFSGKTFTDEEIDKIVNIIPTHERWSWGPDSFTLISWDGIEHLHNAILQTKDVEGDFIETGVWRGGMCIIAKAMYDELGMNKKVYVADSFEGLPRPDPKYEADRNDTHFLSEYLRVPQEQVEDNFKKLECLDDNVIFVKGWFKDTLPNLDIDKISILRLDGDMYESTINALDSLYSKLSVGGMCVIDDYHHAGCKKAVTDFRNNNNIRDSIIKVSPNPIDEIHYWIKT